MRVLYALMAVNVSVFGYAIYVREAARQGNKQPWLHFIRNMSLNLDDVRQGHWWLLFTSTFTHIDLSHIFSNLFTVFFLGRFLARHPIITPTRYFVIAMGSGLSGSFGWLANRYAQERNPLSRKYVRGLGFSGVVMGISSVAACLMPSAKVHLYGIIPVPMWALVAGYAAYDGYYLNDETSKVGHAGHLGGSAFGIVYYFTRLRGLRF